MPNFVAPYMGAWIETCSSDNETLVENVSHPIWVRGLKRQRKLLTFNLYPVAPYMGAWIETTIPPTSSRAYSVAPYMDA